MRSCVGVKGAFCYGEVFHIPGDPVFSEHFIEIGKVFSAPRYVFICGLYLVLEYLLEFFVNPVVREVHFIAGETVLSGQLEILVNNS